MFQRILVPLDGSEYAEAALPMAAHIAQAANGTVVLLHVLSGVREFLPYILPMMEPSTLAADVDAAAAYLEAVAAQPELAQVTTVTEIRSGQAGTTILDVAEEHHADLVVLAARGHTGLARWAPGNVVEHVEHHGKMPVLTLSNINALPPTDRPTYGLVLLDGTSEAEAAIASAKELLAGLSNAERERATLHLAWIGAFEPEGATPHNGREEITQYLKAVEEQLHADSQSDWPLTVTTEVIAEENLHQAVADLAQQQQATFIALAPHGQRGFPLYTSADFDEHLRGATDLPLLLVPHHAMART